MDEILAVKIGGPGGGGLADRSIIDKKAVGQRRRVAQLEGVIRLRQPEAAAAIGDEGSRIAGDEAACPLNRSQVDQRCAGQAYAAGAVDEKRGITRNGQRVGHGAASPKEGVRHGQRAGTFHRAAAQGDIVDAGAAGEENGRAVVNEDVVQRAGDAVGSPVRRREPIGGSRAGPGIIDRLGPAGINRDIDRSGGGQTAVGIGGPAADGINPGGRRIPGITVNCDAG